jgi:2-keto-3-deoxy-L-rhamnonate aldolase RhmA
MMPQTKGLRARALAGERLFGTFLNLGSPQAAEICGRTGLDWVLVDLEHGSATEADLGAHLRAIDVTPATPLVRVEQGTRLRIGRVLDLGADGVMVPQVSTPAEARDIVSWIRFPPAGRRGVALSTRGLDFGSGGHAGVDTRNEEILGIIQVESPAALDAVDEVAAIDGVDVLFVGPTDLSHSLGVRGQLDHPVFLAAVERVTAAAKANSKAAGVLVWKPEEAAAYATRGFTFFSITGDGQLLDRAVRGALGELREVVDAAS